MLLLSLGLAILPASAQGFGFFQGRRPDQRHQERGRDQRDQSSRADQGQQPESQGKPDDRRGRGWGWGRPQNGPGPRAGQWLLQHEGQSLQEQEKALEQDPNFKRLPPERQQRLRERLRSFNSMPPQQRERWVERMRLWNRLNPDQRTRARDLFQRLRVLPHERRHMVNQALRDMRDMSPQERQRVLNSPAFTDNERDIMRGLTDIGIAPRLDAPDDGGF
ncbi:MAG: DUF3106 domain-containing protein [Terriglobales bacterium]